MEDQLVKTVSASTTETSQEFRSQVGHISRHSGVFFAGTIFTAGLGYLFKVYLARVLGAKELGLYALGMTLVSFIGIFNTLGLPQSAVRYVASYKASGKFRELHSLLWRGSALLLGANVLLALVLLRFGKLVAVHFYHSPQLVQYLPFFALIMLFSVVSSFYGKVLAGYRDLKLRTLFVNFIGVPLNMIVAIALISLGMGLRGYLSAQIASAALVSVLLLAAVWHFTPVAARVLAQSGGFPEKEVWSFSAVMLGIGFLEFLMAQVDKVALGFYKGIRDVGIYSVAAALVVYVPLVLSSVNQIFAPTIADLHTRGEHKLLSRLFQSLTKWVLGITFPLAMVIMVFAHPLMRIFGSDFEVGWPILIIGTAGQLINCGVGSVGFLLLMSGNEKRLMRVQTVMAAVMVVTSVGLIPIWGIYGAAAAGAITNIGMNAWNMLEVRKIMGLSPYNRSYLRLLLPAGLTLAVIFVLKKYELVFHHNWLAILVAMIAAYSVFPAVFYFTAGLDADDRLIASALWSRMRAIFLRSGVAA